MTEGAPMSVAGPLADLRIVAVEQYGAGPWATMQLADLGAEVIKVEDPGSRGDVGRYVPPYQQGSDSLFFEAFNRNKKSVSLDLRDPEDRAGFDGLVAGADALFANLRGDAYRKLRLGYEDLRGVNPRLVCCSLSGFGLTGPRAAQGAYDHVIQGLSGWMELTGGPNEPPTRSGLSLVDFCGGYVAALAILAGVWQARRDGRGCECDLSLFEVALAQLNYIGTWALSRGYEPRRLDGGAHQSMVPFQTLRTEDGWIVVACPKQPLFESLCRALDAEHLAVDPRFMDYAGRAEHRAALVRELEARLVGAPTAEWVGVLSGAGVPCGEVRGVEEAFEDPQVEARELIERRDHPKLGTVAHLRSPLRMSTATPAIRRAPFLGEHTDELLGRNGGEERRAPSDLPSQDAEGSRASDAHGAASGKAP